MKNERSKINELLTVVIPVLNEERNLAGCLENLEGLEHVIVVDSASTDSTGAIAAAAGREVVQFRWDGKFPKKRNWVLRNYSFKTPWVMFLDADERLTEVFVSEVAATLPTTRHSAFVCFYDNWFMGRLLRHGDMMRKTAILRVGAGEYERIEEEGWSRLDMEIHEHLQVSGTIGAIAARLEHHDHRSLESYYAKHEEYAKWEAARYRKLMEGGGAKGSALTARQKLKYGLLTRWWFAAAYFAVTYVIKFGFLDGRAGFVFACGKYRYFRSIRSKIKSSRTR